MATSPSRLELLISTSLNLVEWIDDLVNEVPYENVDRHNVANACFATALEHHHAVVTLIHMRLYGSAFAILRALYEAYVRGMWLELCASDRQIEAFVAGERPPSIAVLIASIEEHPAFPSSKLSEVKSKSWDSMCSYAHTGALQVQRWINHDGVGSNHSPDEISEVLRFSNMFGLLAACGVAANAAENANTDRIVGELLQKLSTLPSVPG